MRFGWDAGKAATNVRKHGVSFEEADDVFGAAAVFEDFDHSEREPRYLAIGFSAKDRLLTLSFTRTGPEEFRIISARRATKRERQRYVETKRQNEQSG